MNGHQEGSEILVHTFIILARPCPGFPFILSTAFWDLSMVFRGVFIRTLAPPPIFPIPLRLTRDQKHVKLTLYIGHRSDRRFPSFLSKQYNTTARNKFQHEKLVASMSTAWTWGLRNPSQDTPTRLCRSFSLSSVTLVLVVTSMALTSTIGLGEYGNIATISLHCRFSYSFPRPPFSDSNSKSPKPVLQL